MQLLLFELINSFDKIQMLFHLFDIHYFTRILPTIFGNYIEYYNNKHKARKSFIVVGTFNYGEFIDVPLTLDFHPYLQ